MPSDRKRLALALFLSLLLHALLLGMTFGAGDFGLPGFGNPWRERRVTAPALTVRLASSGSIAAHADPPPAAERLERAVREQAAPAGVALKSATALNLPPDPPSAPTATPFDAVVPPTPPAGERAPAILAVERADAPGFKVPRSDESAAALRIDATAPAVERIVVTSSPATPEEAQELARREADRREAALRAAQVLAAQREEEARLAAAKEAATRAAMAAEARRLEAARLDAQRQEAERAAAAARLEAEALENARTEAARLEAAQREAARLEAARLEALRIEAARQDAAKLEAARRVAELEAQRHAAARLDAQRLDPARRQAEQQAKAEGAAEQDAARAREEREEDARRAARRQAMARILAEEAAQREAAAQAAEAAPTTASLLPLSIGSTRRARLWGRVDPNAALVEYARSVTHRIQFNTANETIRDIGSRPHTPPLVTLALRSDGSVESVVFVHSSGVSAVDEAIRRLIASHAPYPAFSPALAREFDVIEIRRSWNVDTVIRLN
jgi:hypothetical protein